MRTSSQRSVPSKIASIQDKPGRQNGTLRAGGPRAGETGGEAPATPAKATMSVVIIERLLSAGAQIAVHDPEAMTEARKTLGERVSYHKLNYDALQDADALIIVTEWNEFRRPDFDRMKRLMRTPVIFDGRNVYEPQQMAAHGFTYFSMGRRTVRGDDPSPAR